MPVEIVWEEQCVLATYRGDVSHEGIVDSYRRIEGDCRFDEVRCSIIDLRELSPAIPDVLLCASMDEARQALGLSL